MRSRDFGTFTAQKFECPRPPCRAFHENLLLFSLEMLNPSRGRAGHTIILYDCFPNFFVKSVFLQQLYCFQYNRAVGTTPYGKRHISRTKLVSPLQPMSEKGLHWPQSFKTTSRSRKSTHSCVCIPLSCACILVILQPLSRKATWRRSCFTTR